MQGTHRVGTVGAVGLEEMLTDAVDIAILDQERAGLDIITDGESRRLDGYVDGYYAIIDGIRALPAGRRVGLGATISRLDMRRSPTSWLRRVSASSRNSNTCGTTQPCRPR